MNRSLCCGIGMLAVLVAALSPAQAVSVSVYTDRATWEAAVSGVIQTESFNSVAPFVLPNNATSSVGLLDIQTVVPSSAGGNISVQDGSQSLNVNGTNFLNLALDGNPKREAIVYFPIPTRAWGADYLFSSLTDPAQAEFAGYMNNFGGKDATGFIGYISDTPFTQVTFRDPFVSTAFVGLDDISFAGGIPEPATGVLFVIAAGVLARRRRPSSPANARHL